MSRQGICIKYEKCLPMRDILRNLIKSLHCANISSGLPVR